MGIAQTKNKNTEAVQYRYRDNFARHALGLARYLQSQTMHTLREKKGHQGLRLNFEPYIALPGRNGSRLSDIADTLEISRQSANQTANAIEAAGYVTRVADPRDGRARLLVLTAAGKRLRRDGVQVMSQLQRHLGTLVPATEIETSIASLANLLKALQLPIVAGDSGLDQAGAELGGLLPRLAGHIQHRLMELTAQQGHRGLKLSFGQVLTLIGPNGGRIHQIANAQEVSKQAISAIATELETLGYIRREPDPADARQLVLRFTAQGEKLIADSVTSVDLLAEEFSGHIGPRRFQQLCQSLAAMYRALGLENEIFLRANTLDVRVLAAQLVNQLGEDGARSLAQLLLSPQTLSR